MLIIGISMAFNTISLMHLFGETSHSGLEYNTQHLDAGLPNCDTPPVFAGPAVCVALSLLLCLFPWTSLVGRVCKCN